jgi:hypothetical protein
MRIIDLLCNNKGIDYHFSKTAEGFSVEDNRNDLCAIVDEDNDKITYYVSGVYNSGIDYAEINIDALMELKKICEALKTM